MLNAGWTGHETFFLVIVTKKRKKSCSKSKCGQKYCNPMLS